MDTTNQTALSTTEHLQLWWNAKIFAGKEYCSLEEGGQLRVKPFAHKTMSVLSQATGDAVIQNLTEKFLMNALIFSTNHKLISHILITHLLNST
jgi:hypothetical protein